MTPAAPTYTGTERHRALPNPAARPRGRRSDGRMAGAEHTGRHPLPPRQDQGLRRDGNEGRDICQPHQLRKILRVAEPAAHDRRPRGAEGATGQPVHRRPNRIASGNDRPGIDTTDWNRVDAYCRHPRLAGKEFRKLTADELDTLIIKLRIILRKETDKNNNNQLLN